MKGTLKMKIKLDSSNVMKMIDYYSILILVCLPFQLPSRSTLLSSIKFHDFNKLPLHLREALAVGCFIRTPPPSYVESLQSQFGAEATPGMPGDHGERESVSARNDPASMETVQVAGQTGIVHPFLPSLNRSSLHVQHNPNASVKRPSSESPVAVLSDAAVQHAVPHDRTSLVMTPPISAEVQGSSLPIGGASPSRMDASPDISGSSNLLFSHPDSSFTPPISRSVMPSVFSTSQMPTSSLLHVMDAPSIKPSFVHPERSRMTQTSVFAHPKYIRDPVPSGSNLNSSISGSQSHTSETSSHDNEARRPTSQLAESNRKNTAERKSDKNVGSGDAGEADAPDVVLPLSPSVLKTYKQSFADKRRLQHELAEMMCRNNTLSGEIDNLNFEYMTLKNKLLLSQADVGAKETKLDDMEYQLSSLNDELNKTLEELHHVQGELDRGGDAAMPHGTPPLNQFQISELHKDLESAKALNNRYKMELNNERDKKTGLQQLIFDRESEIRQLENKQSMMDTRIQSLQMQKMLMQDQVKHVQAAAAKEVSLPTAPNERIVEMESQLKKAGDELEASKALGKQYQLERNFMETVMIKGEATMKSLRQAVESKNSELEKTQVRTLCK
jgi:predicted  nucleic acid-binding Zn-ribbon protein